MNLFLGIHPSKMEYEVQQSNLFQIQDKKKKQKQKQKKQGYSLHWKSLPVFFYIKPYSLMKIHNVF